MANDFGIKIYLDCANLTVMKGVEARHPGLIDGFTTNPTLMRKAGVTDYETFAKDVLDHADGRPVSFEVTADNFSEMGRQAEKIASWGGDNIFVKIPVTTTKRTTTRTTTTAPLVRSLLGMGIRVNVTAVFTVDQIERLITDLRMERGRVIVSIFAGRIANAGVDPVARVSRCVDKMCLAGWRGDVLWASPRQVFDVVQAKLAGADIITLTPALIDQLHLLGKNLNEYSLETVRMFYDDAVAAGYDL